MKILFGYYQDLFLRTGGLQNQILQLKQELSNKGAEIFFPHEINDIKEIDIYHQFSINYSTSSLYDYCYKQGKKIVLSPVYNRKYHPLRDTYLRLISNILNNPKTYLSIQKGMLNKSDVCIFLGEYEKKNIEKIFKPKIEEYVFIPNGIPRSFFTKGNIAKEGDYIICVSSIYELKNQVLLAKLANKLNLKVKLVGPVVSDKYLEKIQAIDQNNLVEIIGYVDNKSDRFISLLQNSSLFILPSLNEVFPLSVLEALSQKVPVLCTKNCVLTDYFKNKKEIAFFDPDNIKDLLSKTEKQLNVKNFDIKMDQFSWEKIAENYLDVYKKIL